MASVELDRAGLTFRVRQQHQLTFKEYLLKGMFRQARNPLFEVPRPSGRKPTHQRRRARRRSRLERFGQKYTVAALGRRLPSHVGN